MFEKTNQMRKILTKGKSKQTEKAKICNFIQRRHTGTSLVVQWLSLHTPNAGGRGSIPGQGTRSHIPQLRVCMPQLEIPHAATKRSRTWQQRSRMLQLRPDAAKNK